MERHIPVNLISREKVYNFIINKQNRCVLCLDASDLQYSLCEKCLFELPYNSPSCIKCSQPLVKGSICGDCSIKTTKPVDRIISVFRYKYPINRLLIDFKFNRNLTAGNILGHLMAERLIQEFQASATVDLIIPVPLHSKRLLHRGYNQAAELSKCISNKLDLPLGLNVCKRIKHTSSQTTFNAQQRRANVSKAFGLNRCVKDKSIAIVDDVITTGSTVNELAKTLKSAGASSVQAWCCAVNEL